MEVKNQSLAEDMTELLEVLVGSVEPGLPLAIEDRILAVNVVTWVTSDSQVRVVRSPEAVNTSKDSEGILRRSESAGGTFTSSFMLLTFWANSMVGRGDLEGSWATLCGLCSGDLLVISGDLL